MFLVKILVELLQINTNNMKIITKNAVKPHYTHAVQGNWPVAATSVKQSMEYSSPGRQNPILWSNKRLDGIWHYY